MSIWWPFKRGMRITGEDDTIQEVTVVKETEHCFLISGRTLRTASSYPEGSVEQRESWDRWERWIDRNDSIIVDVDGAKCEKNFQPSKKRASLHVIAGKDHQ